MAKRNTLKRAVNLILAVAIGILAFGTSGGQNAFAGTTVKYSLPVGNEQALRSP
jgi:hypothetical protein